MSRSRPRPTQALTLTPVLTHCPACRHRLWAAYDNERTVATLDGVLRLTLRVRRCSTPGCSRFHRPYRPEAEAHFALPHLKVGLDVLAAVGRLRHVERRTLAEIQRELTRRGVLLSSRTVANLLERYDELRARDTADPERLGGLLRGQDCVVLALDGLRPDVGQEVLWLLRDCLSGEVLVSRSLLSATTEDLTALLAGLRDALPVRVVAVVSDGQEAICQAVAMTWPGVPHQSCPFHDVRAAAMPISLSDPHGKKPPER